MTLFQGHVADHREAIIDRDTWWKVQEKRKERTKPQSLRELRKKKGADSGVAEAGDLQTCENREGSGKIGKEIKTGASTTCRCWKRKAGAGVRTENELRFRGAFGLSCICFFGRLVRLQCTSSDGTVRDEGGIGHGKFKGWKR